ncbi:thymidine kinase [Candidatus Aerophobetes bacterium]|uniref:Thymidine kinase n=1 Tax=Aerophobetes bacterium TaxID=2030807 RepID=A0A2A4X189_UNCAE|nr:MAG: thymidine kinase [Candidatus Aerophobetes bacterium]
MAKLYYYYSTMNAGKSTTLLQASHNYLERGMQTLLFSPAIDTRGGTATIESRIGLKKEAISFDINFNFFEYVREKKSVLHTLSCVLIDESQFLTKLQVIQLTDVASTLSIPVLCYGLRSDFQGEPFEGSKYLLTLAEEMIEIKTVCSCGKKATMNMRIGPDGEPVREGAQVHIGGNEAYTAKCMKCFKAQMPSMRSSAVMQTV